jgi:hypothetical protein
MLFLLSTKRKIDRKLINRYWPNNYKKIPHNDVYKTKLAYLQELSAAGVLSNNRDNRKQGACKCLWSWAMPNIIQGKSMWSMFQRVM